MKRGDLLVALGLATLAVASVAVPLDAARRGAEARGGAWTGLDASRDLAQYACIADAARDGGGVLLANPYAPGSDRTVLAIGLSAAGWIARFAGVDVAAALVLVHLAAVSLFPFALLRLLAGLGLGAATRRVAAVVVVLGGGMAFFVARLAEIDPSVLRWRTDVEPSYGWSTLAALANPLWALALGLGLLAIDALVRAERSPAPARLVGLGVLAALLYPTHAYLGGGLLVVLGALAVVSPARSRLLAALAPAVALAAGHVALVFGGDAQPAGIGRVLRAHTFTPLEAIGGLGLLIPLGLAGLAILRHRPADRGALRVLGVWLAVAVALAWNPFVIGVKFATLIHPPLAALSGVALLRLARGGRGRAALALATAAVVLSAAPQVVRIRAANAASGYAPYARLEPGEAAVLAALADAPPGPVLSVETAGVRLPWLAGRTPWLGHWFLTPEFAARREEARGLFAPERAGGMGGMGGAAAFCRERGIAVVLWREGDEAFFGECPPATWPRFLVADRSSLVLVPAETE